MADISSKSIKIATNPYPSHPFGGKRLLSKNAWQGLATCLGVRPSDPPWLGPSLRGLRTQGPPRAPRRDEGTEDHTTVLRRGYLGLGAVPPGPRDAESAVHRRVAGANPNCVRRIERSGGAAPAGRTSAPCGGDRPRSGVCAPRIVCTPFYVEKKKRR